MTTGRPSVVIEHVISGKHTHLRPTTMADLDVLAGWLRDPEVYRWWGGKPLQREDVAARYTGARRPAVHSFVVEHKGQPFGYIQAWVADANSAASICSS